MGFGLSLYLNMPDPQPRERHYVFGGMYLAYALWIGLGWVAIVEWVRTRWASAPLLPLVAMALFGLLLPAGTFARLYHATGSHGRLHRLRLRTQSARVVRTQQHSVYQRGQRHLSPVVSAGGRGPAPRRARGQPQPTQHQLVYQAAARPRTQTRHTLRRHVYRFRANRYAGSRHLPPLLARAAEPVDQRLRVGDARLFRATASCVSRTSWCSNSLSGTSGRVPSILRSPCPAVTESA